MKNHSKPYTGQLIVGEENSLSKLKQETENEGFHARKKGEGLGDCKYTKGSTFEKWWKKGWNDCDLLVHVGRQLF